MDNRGIISRTNLAAVALLGATRQGLKHSDFSRFISPNYEDAYRSARGETGETGNKHCIELPLKRENGSTLWARVDIEADRDVTDAVIQWRLIIVDISELKRNEAELKKLNEEIKDHSLKVEMQNTALNVLLDNRAREKERFADDILTNFEKMVFPYFKKARKSRELKETLTYLDIIQRNMDESLSALEKPIVKAYRSFTPMEIQVADLIKSGKTGKEIAKALHISTRSVYFHRQNLRRKLGAHNTQKNLKSLLLTLR